MLAVVVFLFFAAADFSQQFRAGLVALNNDDLPRARQTLEAAAKLRPRNAEVWVALAQTYRKLKSDGLAAAAANKAEQYAESSPAAIHALAVFYMQGGNFEKAANLESRYAVTDESAFADAAVYWIKANRPKAAIECAQRAVAHDGGAEMHALLAAAYDADGQFPNAAQEYDRAIELAPYDESYYFELAQDYLKRQQFDAAAQVLERGVKLFDKSAQLELALGVAYYGQRRFGDATDAFLRTLDISPEVEQPYVFLGKMLDQAGDRLPEIVKRFEVRGAANPARCGGAAFICKSAAGRGRSGGQGRRTAAHGHLA